MSKSAFTDTYAAVIASLRALRREQKVSQVELARRLGRPQQFVSYFESGIRRIDMVEFVVIVRALGGDPKALFAKLVDAMPMDVRI